MNKRKIILPLVIGWSIISLCGCSDFFSRLAETKNDVLSILVNGKNSAIEQLTDSKESILEETSEKIGDGPQNAILEAFSVLTNTVGKTALTNNNTLKGTRIFNTDTYTGEYKADYEDFSGVEILFGGTSLERQEGKSIQLNCSMEGENGEAIIFIRKGNQDPVVCVNTEGEYVNKIDITGSSTYVGVWANEFTGHVTISTK